MYSSFESVYNKQKRLIITPLLLFGFVMNTLSVQAKELDQPIKQKAEYVKKKAQHSVSYYQKFKQL